MLDLYRATRDELIRVIEQQRQVIETMEHRLGMRERELSEVRAVLATVTAQLGAHAAGSADDAGRGGPPPGMPGLKPTSLIAVLREEARLPFGVIQRLLTTLTGVQLSVGALVAAVARVAARAEPVLAQLADAIRVSPVVHADETGWREAGRNGYVWTFSSPGIRLLRRGSRAKGMVSDVLGGTLAGVLVSDFYAAYTGDDGTHQYCWAHLSRDIDELVKQHPADAALVGWAAAVRAIFTRAQAASGSHTERWRVRRLVQADLRQVCEPWLDPRVAQTPLCVRITRYLERLFVFVTEPGVPATNNAAERSLRHLVVSRKVSGGTRSARGTATKMALASLFGTWRAQGRNPYLACRDVLASPQV